MSRARWLHARGSEPRDPPLRWLRITLQTGAPIAAASSAVAALSIALPPFVLWTLPSVAISPAGALQIGAPVRFAWN